MQECVTQSVPGSKFEVPGGIDQAQVAGILASLIARSGFKSPLFALVGLALSGNYMLAWQKVIPGHDGAFYSALCIVAFTLADTIVKWIVARHPALTAPLARVEQTAIRLAPVMQEIAPAAAGMIPQAAGTAASTTPPRTT
jgi:hypothetical protein